MNQLVRDAQRWKMEGEAHFIFGEAKLIGPYEIKNRIGEGSSGSVKLAINIQSSTSAAVKIVSKAVARKRRDARKEIKILQNSRHPNIVPLEFVEEDFQNIYIFTEYQENGDLYSYLERNGPLDEHRAKYFAKQMIDAVEYCHEELHIAHHDIKLENFVLNSSFQIKLIDFGFAVEIDPSAGQKMITSFDSSPAYACLEILLRRPHDKKCDIFSLGVCFFIILCGYFPFCDPERTSYDELCRNLQSSQINYPPQLSSEARDLLEEMLLKKENLTWDQIRNHSWFAYDS